MIFLLLATYPISTSTVTSSFSLKKKKKISGFEKFCFSFHLRCCENENLWWFSPYPVTTTMIWPITDRIPHSSIFKRMQIKRIADNIRAFSFLLTNWNKEPDEERIYRWTEFFSQVGQSSSSVGCRADDYELPPATTILWLYIYIYIYIYSVRCSPAKPRQLLQDSF